MNIPNRVKNFIKLTNSFCVIMEDNEPAYIVATFDWAERIFLPEDLEEIEQANDDISVVAVEERIEELPTTDV